MSSKVKLLNEDVDWNLIACYGTPYRGGKTRVLAKLNRASWRPWEEPWLLVGDLNEVINDSENRGGVPRWKKKLFLKNSLGLITDKV